VTPEEVKAIRDALQHAAFIRRVMRHDNPELADELDTLDDVEVAIWFCDQFIPAIEEGLFFEKAEQQFGDRP
jgi:hypothetical protein